MKIACSLIALAAAFALPASAIAQDARCVSREESRAVVANLMPTLIASTARKCAPQLGAGSFLAANGELLGHSLTPHAEAAWPGARAALERLGGDLLPDNPALIDLGRIALAERIAGKLDADTCRLVDTLTQELAPLPPENFANVFALFLEAGMNTDQNAAFKVCRASA